MLELDYFGKLIEQKESFQAAATVLELGGGNFNRTTVLAQKYPDKLFYATDYLFAAGAVSAIPALMQMSNVRVAQIDAQDIALRDHSFEFVFSVALMEHVPNLASCLQEVERILKPGGHYFFAQAPFWSCSKGHHYQHWVKEVMDELPAYGHLYLDEHEMRAQLLAKHTTLDVDEVIDQVYYRRDLSRLGRNQTYDIVNDSSLSIVEWKDNPDNLYDEDNARVAQLKSRYDVTFEEMKHVGADVLLKKVLA